MNYKSQIGQDKFICEHIYSNKKNGFFIELGAADGIHLSNTYYMEKELNWDGICIEPAPKFKDALIKNRSCKKYFCPVFSSSGKDVEFSIVDCGELSGISNYLGNIGNYKIEDKVTLKTKTLTEILDEINAPIYIDYLSLDTEGTELEILKGLDFSKYVIGYISIEHNFRPLRSEIRDYLLKKGYIFSRWNRFDDEYMHNLLARSFAWSNLEKDITPPIEVVNNYLNN